MNLLLNKLQLISSYFDHEIYNYQMDLNGRIKKNKIFKPVAFWKADWRLVRNNGVYLMGNFYVGESVNISSRMTAHANDFNRIKNGRSHIGKNTRGIGEWIRSFEEIGAFVPMIPIFFLSRDQMDEYYWHGVISGKEGELIGSKYKCKGFPKNAPTKSELKAMSSLESKGFSIEWPEKELPFTKSELDLSDDILGPGFHMYKK